MAEAQVAQKVVRTDKENNLRIELNRASQQLANWSKSLALISNDNASNMAKSMIAYSQNLKKVVDAN